MKVYRGTRRLVLVFKRVVIKLPIGNMPVSWRLAIGSPIYCFIEKFGWGIWENWQEFMTWLRLRSPFLVPVYVSIGVITIQKRAVGEPVELDDLVKVIGRIQARTNGQLMKLSLHNFDQDNWIKGKWGYQMVDIGGRASGLHLRTFLVRWRRVLEEELSR